MRIIGFNLTKIAIERKEEISGDLKITQNVDIKELVKEKTPVTKDEVLKIKFKFEIKYSNDIAKLEFEGNIILMPDKDEMKMLLDSWKDKKIPETSRIPLFNFIMSKCNIKALSLEDELNLPLHIPLPRLKIGQGKK